MQTSPETHKTLRITKADLDTDNFYIGTTDGVQEGSFQQWASSHNKETVLAVVQAVTLRDALLYVSANYNFRIAWLNFALWHVAYEPCAGTSPYDLLKEKLMMSLCHLQQSSKSMALTMRCGAAVRSHSTRKHGGYMQSGAQGRFNI